MLVEFKPREHAVHTHTNNVYLENRFDVDIFILMDIIASFYFHVSTVGKLRTVRYSVQE